MENGRLEKQIRLPLDELKLAFAASCVEGLARKTGKPYIDEQSGGYRELYTQEL